MSLYEIHSMAWTSSTISSCSAQIGGGISINNAFGAIAITNLHMDACSASESGGGIRAKNAALELTSVAFSNCSAGDGRSHDLFLDSGASATCSATCTPGLFAAKDAWACSEPYQAAAYDTDTDTLVDCEPYCLSSNIDCEVCGADTFLSASMITADGSAECGECYRNVTQRMINE